MNNEEKEYLSQEKYEELKKEIVELKTIKRKEIAESLEFAKSLGDLSENAEYQEAREAQANLEERIAKIESILKNVSIVSGNSKDVVGMGSAVTVKKDPEGESKKFFIVGTEESDILNNKVSNEYPIGMSLMGKKAGDVASFNTPKGAVKYKIVNIE